MALSLGREFQVTSGLLAGTDEAGRGPLAGDVLAAAVILDPRRPISGLNDSKLLSERRRNELYTLILEQALAWSVQRATVEEIDRLNILQASLLAMHRAVCALLPSPDYVLVDGNRCPSWQFRSSAMTGGDRCFACIAAASILAKVTRDREMVELDVSHPGYGFAAHKGYPTVAHLAALRRLGPSPVHRRSFAPVAAVIDYESGSSIFSATP